MNQLNMFDDEPTPVEETHTDPTLPEDAMPRLGGQNGLILARLREGPATNIELERVSGSRRINSRVADVRRWLRTVEGKTVECQSLDSKKGIFLYGIKRGR